MFTVMLLLLITAGAGLTAAQFDEGGFPEVLKRAAFEEIIGNYYAFDPFLQTGRKGRELNGVTDELQFSPIFGPTFEFSPITNTNEDLTYYSIPPALTPLESKDQDRFEDTVISVNNRPPIHHDVRQVNDLHSNRPFKFETEFNSFNNDDYPPYPPFLTEQSVRQQEQLSPDISLENSLPKYVIGVAGEEGTEDNIFNTKPRSQTVRRQTVYRDQFVRQARPAPELDESPFARRTLRYLNDEEPQRYNRARFNRRRAAEDIPYSRNIRNGHYIASKVLWRDPSIGQRSSRFGAISPSVYAD